MYLPAIVSGQYLLYELAVRPYQTDIYYVYCSKIQIINRQYNNCNVDQKGRDGRLFIVDMTCIFDVYIFVFHIKDHVTYCALCTYSLTLKFENSRQKKMNPLFGRDIKKRSPQWWGKTRERTNQHGIPPSHYLLQGFLTCNYYMTCMCMHNIISAFHFYIKSSVQ